VCRVCFLDEYSDRNDESSARVLPTQFIESRKASFDPRTGREFVLLVAIVSSSGRQAIQSRASNVNESFHLQFLLEGKETINIKTAIFH
jgi:hypothetical protein